MFQSTRPVWGATQMIVSLKCDKDVSIHAPRVGRDLRHLPRAGKVHVSIHAPRVGRDLGHVTIGRREFVSIHAPRVGRDTRRHHVICFVRRFNPRAPCGARRQKKLRLPSFATYLWVLLATNMIFSMSEQHTLLSCAAST